MCCFRRWSYRWNVLCGLRVQNGGTGHCSTLAFRRDAIEKKLGELGEFNEMAVDRELRMIELKQEINALNEQNGGTPQYDVGQLDGECDPAIAEFGSQLNA